MKASVTVRVLALAVVVCGFGAGCGDNENVNIDLGGATSTPIRTPSPGVKTSTPIRTATAGAVATATVTAGGATATAGGPTASPTPGGSSAQAKTATDNLLPFFVATGLATTADVSTSTQGVTEAQVVGQPDPASGMANCPNGGTRTELDAIPVITVTLAACKVTNGLGSFQFDGTITANLVAANAVFNVTVQDLVHSTTVMYTGTIQGGPSGGGFVVNGGPITIHTPQGNFTLTANNVTVDSSGNVVSGGGTVVDTDNAFVGLKQITLTIRTGGLLADVVATFDDNSTANFVLNIKTGVLTPA